MVILVFLLSFYLGMGVGFTAALEEDFGYGPVKRFLVTPALVLFLPAVEAVFWLMEDRD